MNPRILICVLAIVCLAALAAPALAWHEKGHDQASRLALAALKTASQPAATRPVPAFFLAGDEAIAQASVDPDLFTKPIAPPQLHNAESSEHYFDVEALPDQTLPPLRYDFLEILARKNLKAHKVGLLIYSVTEWKHRLTIALAEHRKWPDNPFIQAKCLVYAGILGHYAQDLCQPLHTTIHFDGRSKPDGTSPRTGIHNRVDTLAGKFACDANAILKDIKLSPFKDTFADVQAEFQRSHALVEDVYKLEPLLPAADDPIGADPNVLEFTAHRLRAAAAFTASLYLTAWLDSAAINLPDWHKR